VDIAVLNDAEARMLSEEHNLIVPVALYSRRDRASW
jgi:hypothetical protein